MKTINFIKYKILLRITFTLGLYLISLGLLAQNDSTPSKKFMAAIDSIKKSGFKPVPSTSITGISGGYTHVSHDGVYRALDVSDTFYFADLDLWHINLKRIKPIEPNTFPDIDLYEFSFWTDESFENCKKQMPLFSKLKWDMKIMNDYWVVNNKIYFVSTRAAMFEKDYKKATATLKKLVK